MGVYYVDFDNGLDAIGGGSLASPWKTVQYALDHISGGYTTAPHTIYCRGTTAYAATLSFAIYGRPSITQSSLSLVIEGYDQVPGDGGLMNLTFPPTVQDQFIYDDAVRWVTVRNVHVRKGRTNNPFVRCSIFHLDRVWCEYNGFNNAQILLALGNRVTVTRCVLTGGMGQGIICLSGNLLVMDSYIRATEVNTNGSLIGAYNNDFLTVSGCVVVCEGRTTPTTYSLIGHYVNGLLAAANIFGNTIVNAASYNAAAVQLPGTSGFAADNIIWGFNGASGAAIVSSQDTNARQLLAYNNTIYNCTQGLVNCLDGGGNVITATDPLTNVTGNDFTPVKGVAPYEDAVDLPGGYAIPKYKWRGAVQPEAGGGTGRPIFSSPFLVPSGRF